MAEKPQIHWKEPGIGLLRISRLICEVLLVRSPREAAFILDELPDRAKPSPIRRDFVHLAVAHSLLGEKNFPAVR